MTATSTAALSRPPHACTRAPVDALDRRTEGGPAALRVIDHCPVAAEGHAP